MTNQVIDIDLMSTVQGTATNDQGFALYIVLKKYFLNDMKVQTLTP